jgi:uncharacterized membrane protein YdfJ with MMPL/SSD domain
MCWVALAGLAVGALGQARAGQQAKVDADAQAAIGELQATDELARGGMEEDRYRRQVAQITGAQKAEIGARNVKGGTALDLLSDTAMIGEEDALNIRNESARTAWGYKYGADESRRYGKAARSQANMQAGSTLLTGAAAAYGQWASK